MRTANKVWLGIAAGVFAIVAISDLATSNTTTDTAAPPAANAPDFVGAVGKTAPPPSSPATTATARPVKNTATVSQVIDGDTFIADGQKIRVLGIDSCEVSTYGGEQAKLSAEIMLDGEQVTLRREPGVDKDKSGRLLRYVDLPSGDFAESMVTSDHTGVFQGKNNASQAYLTKLRKADPNGRHCAAPTYSAPSSSSDDGSLNLPSPGDQGLPDGTLTGGFCARKWWC